MPNKIYSSTETKISFTTGASAQIVSFEPTNLPNNSGHMSDPRDFGSSSHAANFKWRSKSVLNSAPSNPSGTIEMYWSSFEEISGETPINVDGNLSSGVNSIVDDDVRHSLHWIGTMHNSGRNQSNNQMNSSGHCFIPARYGSIVWFNYTGVALTGTAADHEFQLYPFPDEVQ